MNWVRSLTKGDITKINAVLNESHYTTLTWRRMNLHESEFVRRDAET